MARSKTRRTFTKEFKLEIIREIDADTPIAQIARAHDVHRRPCATGTAERRNTGSARSPAATAPTPTRRGSLNWSAPSVKSRSRMPFKKSLSDAQGARAKEARKAVMRTVLAHDALPVAQLSRCFGISRASIYRARSKPKAEQVELREAIRRVAIAWPYYGYRSITGELKRRNWHVNEKRVRRLMRLDSLLCQRKRSRWKLYKRHGLPTYENLAAGFRPTAINQHWVADFTYVNVRGSWIFVAVILDAFSRRCIGWSIATHARTQLVLDALQMALRRRRPPPGMLHHSDRGSQYAAADYVTILEKHGIVPSMSAAGNPYHNALCERFMRTLKTDEIYVRSTKASLFFL